MKTLKNKKIIEIFAIIIGLIIVLFMTTGCNKTILDTQYTFDKIICNYDGDKFELNIDKWDDYDGEQIQIKSNGKIYLLSMNKCYMTRK